MGISDYCKVYKFLLREMRVSYLSISGKEGRLQRKLLTVTPDDRVQQSVEHPESHLKNDSQDILLFLRMEAHLFHCRFSHHIVPGKDIYARSAVPRNPNQEPLFDQK